METLFWVVLGCWLVLLTAVQIWLMIELKAMQKSTHQVTYLNPLAEADKIFEKVDEDGVGKVFSDLERQGSIL